MLKNLRQLYAMAICFFAALSLMIGSAMTIIELINLGFPEQRCTALSDFVSNDRYMEKKKKDASISWEDYNKKKPYDSTLDKWSDADITTKRIQERVETLQNYHNTNLRDLTNSLIWILISGLFFGIHWRLYKKS